MFRHTLETSLYWRSDERPPDVIFDIGFQPLSPSQYSDWWKDCIRLSPTDNVPDSFPEKCISASTVFSSAAVFPVKDNEMQNQINYTYIYAIALPKAVKISQKKEIETGNNAIPANNNDIPIDLNAFQFDYSCNDMSSQTLSETNKKCMTGAGRVLYAFEAIFSSVSTHNIIGAVRVQRGAQCLEFYQNSAHSLFYAANTCKFNIEPGIFINDKFKQIQELAVVSKQQAKKDSIDYSSCQTQAIRFMKKASRNEIWQASRLSYGLMGKTLIFGKHVGTTLYPLLDRTKLLKEIGIFKVEDLQFSQEDEEVNRILIAARKSNL